MLASAALPFSACDPGASTSSPGTDAGADAPIVDTGQTRYFDDAAEITAPAAGAAFYGQDAAYTGLQASYADNGDGTVTDDLTGVMWIKDHDVGDGTISDAATGNTGTDCPAMLLCDTAMHLCHP